MVDVSPPGGVYINPTFPLQIEVEFSRTPWLSGVGSTVSKSLSSIDDVEFFSWIEEQTKVSLCGHVTQSFTEY